MICYYSSVNTYTYGSLQLFLPELDYPHHYRLPQLQPVSAMLVGHVSECCRTYSATFLAWFLGIP